MLAVDFITEKRSSYGLTTGPVASETFLDKHSVNVIDGSYPNNPAKGKINGLQRYLSQCLTICLRIPIRSTKNEITVRTNKYPKILDVPTAQVGTNT